MTDLPELPAIDAVIFDMDGVLIDSERLYLQAWQIVADDLNCPEIVPLFPEIVGLPFDELQRVLQRELKPPITLEVLRLAVGAALEPILTDGYPMKPGTIEILTYLEGRKIPCAVATSSTTSVSVKLNDNGIDHFFQHVVSRDQVQRGKPHPDIFLEAAERLGATPARCLAVEDSKHGLRAAIAAGMHVVHIPDIAVIERELTNQCLAVLPGLPALRDWLAQAD
ncbi:MAG: HAD family phosphatase [Alphaproteobacteria bacterium]|jgi:HAD superfamily hydrolase (TIGR01509 family)|nr:HAD family phosphatase [Alphaproteobacteria bacterium]MDP6876378.1 HAD family phosphatase [Alphaproteobacteria bacterium]